MDATTKSREAITRALDDEDVKCALFALYFKDSKYSLHLKLVGGDLQINIEKDRLVSLFGPTQHAIVVVFKWEEQPGVLDGDLMTCKGFNDDTLNRFRRISTLLALLSEDELLQFLSRYLRKSLLENLR